jgi:hypothetical protein
MVSPLIEVKRPRRLDQEQIGFARSDALVGLAPNGTAHLLENDRLKVAYTALAPGESVRSGPHLGRAVCVIDGGVLAVGESGAQSELDSPTQSGYWREGTVRRFTNVGTTVYRESVWS